MGYRIIIQSVENGYAVIETSDGDEPVVTVFQDSEDKKCELDALIYALYHVSDCINPTGRYDQHRIAIVCKPGDKLDEPENCPNRYENQWWGCQGKPSDYLCPKRPPDKDDEDNE